MKQDILDYITNNVTQTTGTNEPIFNSTTLQTSVSDRINTLLGAFVFSGYLYDQQTQNIAIYGYYDSKSYGFIYIIDKDLNELKMITQFTSGLNLFPIMDMNQDETGNVYALSENVTADGSIKRVLLLNNIFVKLPNGNYQARLRQSYIVPYNALYVATNTVFWRQKTKKIIKVPGEATYFMFLRKSSKSYIVRFTINVGSDNEWVLTNTNIDGYGYDVLIEKNNDTVTLYYYCANLDSAPDHIFSYTLTNDVFTLIGNVATDIEIEFIFAKSTNEIYFGGNDSNVTNGYLKKLVNNSYITLDTFDKNTYLTMQKINEIVALFKKKSTINPDQTLDYTGCVGILQQDVPYYSSFLSSPNAIVSSFVMLSYNLLIFYLITGTNGNQTTTKYTLDYNPVNFNGNDYTDYDSTVPKKARLFSNSEMIFARNLYNLTLNGATYTATVQVPNIMLNNVTIDQEDLISNTNSLLITNSQNIQKNIYETLYINFIQYFTVTDEDTNTSYPVAAAYVNQNINTGTQDNCNDSFVGKVKINYAIPFTQNITWNYVTDHYETTFLIDATNEAPSSIDFMSNDETTLYITKNLTFTTGNYYLINQKLRIE